MSLTKEREMTEESLAAHQANGRQSQGPVTPEGKAHSAAANLRHAFYSQSRAEVLLALGEQPEDYLSLMESLCEDLQPREGLESQLVTQMGETLWGMQRAQRMREGLARKRIESRAMGEQVITTTHAAKAIENVEPFERLQAALARRDDGPTAEEIEAFVKCRKGDSSERTQEFIRLLRSLKNPMEEADRKAVRRQVRAELGRLIETYQSVAMHLARQSERVQSPENLAALMAPVDSNSLLLQRMEDSHLRRLWRLTNTLMKVRKGGLTRKDVKNEGRSGNVYENKGSHDNLSEDNSDISAGLMPILQKKAEL
jgi:flagellar biosynthesis/type III secretory pathway chaperone